MTRSLRSVAVACTVLAMALGTTSESQACFGWFSSSSPCGTTTYRPLFPFLTGYRGVAASPCCSTCSTGCSTCATGCSTCAPQVSTCNSCYRVAYSPVVSYRPACGGCNSCNSCGTTVLRPVVSYQPSYSAPAATYASPVISTPVYSAPSSGCSSCGASVSRPGAPVVSRIVQQGSPVVRYSAPAAVSAPIASAAPTTSYAPSNASYAPPGGSYSSTAPVARTPVIPRPGPSDSQPVLLAPINQADADLPQRAIPDVRTSSPKARGLLNEDDGADRTTMLPSHRTQLDNTLADDSSAVIPAQHTRPAKQKIDDSGWRPLR